MSANDGARMARKPYSERAHTACSRDEDGGALGLGPVELECGIQAAVGPEAPIVEQGGTEAGALHPLQELLRNDLVGVHVGARQRGHGAGVADERLDHDAARSRSPSLSHAHSRTSTSRPATAAAAAMGGQIG